MVEGENCSRDSEKDDGIGCDIASIMRDGLVLLGVFVTLCQPRTGILSLIRGRGAAPRRKPDPSSYPRWEAQAGTMRLLTETDQQGLQGAECGKL